MEEDLPYRVEYSKSNRAMCKGCKLPIAKDVCRIARMVQSGFHDGKQPNWFHEKCFFAKFRPNTTGDIAGFELLRYDDQKRVEQKLCEPSTIVVKKAANGKGKKRPHSVPESEVQMTSGAVKDYGIEYSSTSRATCKGCELKIMKGDIRAKKISFETEVGMKYGGQPLWHHLECFAKLRTELGWIAGGKQLPGFSSLSKDDQKKTMELLPSVTADEIADVKKMKTEPKDEVDKALDNKLISQNKLYHKNRAMLKEHLKKVDMIEILEANKQQIPEGNDAVLDATTDLITFGVLLSCPDCNGQFIFNKANYICSGNISEWQKCEKILVEPPRRTTQLSKEIVSKLPKFSRKINVTARAMKYVPPTTVNIKVKKEDEMKGPKLERTRPPLYLLEFVIIGHTKLSKDDIKKDILSLGGVVGTKIHKKMAAVISTEADVKKMNSNLDAAEKYGIQVLPESFLDCAKETGADVIQLIKTMSLCDWGTDPLLRVPREEANNKSKSIYTKSVSKSVTLKLKNGTVVDPDSGLDDVSHVYTQGKIKYFAILSKIDIQRDKNSYYKIQLLEADNKKKYYIFRAWGRIGTKIGGNKVQTYHDISEAINDFQTLYQELSGNVFGTKNFVKIPDRYYPIDVDYGEKEMKKITENSGIKSKLKPSVQELIKLLFDIDAMKKVMLDFDLDMEKMPLGKLSQKQLNEAMKVLHDISELVQSGAENSKFIGKTNHFYTLVPHDFGVERPTILDNIELVNAKTEMIESLMEIEIAYNLLQSDTGNLDVNPLDTHYDQLKTDIRPLDHNDSEFKLLEKYVQNTHAATHSNFSLVIDDIFKIERSGEKRRYKPFKKLHNRKLLWHGSRLTNYVGILSHGLKIAPPDAPVTGYMFGKGIYFADMVSKSANYCCTSTTNRTGLMLLCEVALGDMEEYTAAKYVTQLPKNKHSTKGIGQTYPNPSESHVREDGVEIPLGKSVTDSTIKSSLLYNEFIVYDVAQINVQYLFKMNFKYNY